MLAQRKKLFRKRRNISDVAFVTALVGIILMIIHTELITGHIYTNASAAAIVVKVFITLSTVDLLGMLIWYHLVDTKVSVSVGVSVSKQYPQSDLLIWL